MVGSSKILTVSYGTFSCTLEGFDDAFTTMKAIAEYFRDLAADDRYFGAEPPQPDAEMLARIAEREIARRVEARASETGVHLTAAQLAAPAMESPAPAPADEPEAEADAAPVAEVQREPVADEQAATPAEAEGVARATTITGPADETSVAAKLERIRAVVGRKDAAPEFEDDDADGLDLGLVDTPNGAAFTAPEEPEETVETAEADAPAPEPEDTAEELAPAEVVEEVAEAAPDAGDEDAQVRPLELDVDPDVEVTEEAAEVEAEEEPETVAETAQPEVVEMESDEVDEFEALVAAVSADDTGDMAPEIEDDLADDVAETADPLADEIAAATVSVPHDEADEAALEEGDAALSAALAALNARSAPEAEADTAPDPRPIRARIIRMKRPAFDEAMAEAEPFDTSETIDTDPVADADALEDLARVDGAPSSGEVTPASLSPEEEEDLLRELAELDGAGDDSAALPDLIDEDEETVEEALEGPSIFADDGDDDFDTDTAIDVEGADEDDAETAEETQSARRSKADFLKTDPDATDVPRILDDTASRMAEPESNRRRDAISHLKAAVAATEAARVLGDDETDADRENAFREDLDEVVRPRPTPRRPVAPSTRGERPRPAPLKLVASQRVDLPKAKPRPADAGPVVPRRVARPAGGRPESQDDFNRFAAERGARTFAEILEAAAAYMVFVEGEEEFSRPALLRRVREYDPESFVREEVLINFRALLAEGRIEEAGEGRYSISTDTRFHPERRSAG